MLLTAAVLALGIPTAELKQIPQPLSIAQDEQPTEAERRPQTQDENQIEQPTGAVQVDLEPQVIDNSPVLQRWLEDIPDLDADIRHDPALRSRLRVGYSQSLSDDSTAEGWIGVEDIFIEDTPLAISGEYRTSLEDSTQQSYSGEMRYYLRPLGSSVNFAPVVGYRSLDTEETDIAGLVVGMRLVLALSRNGASDISLSQVWINPRSGEELGLTTIAAGYAVTSHVRVGTEMQIRNSADVTQHQIGVGLEWMF